MHGIRSRYDSQSGRGAHLRVSETGERGALDGQGSSGKRYVLPNVVITVLLAVVLFAMGPLKCGLDVDEYWTFILSNHTYASGGPVGMLIEDGVSYSGEDLWEEYLTVNYNESFDYANVFANQAADVHPPLFYLIVHTLCSLFPDMSVFLLGLLVNVPLSIVVFWQMVWIARRLGMGKWSSLAVSALYVLGIGYISFGLLFFRMYALMTVWANFLAMLFLAYHPTADGCIRYYLLLGLVILAGTLTQYYFLLLAFLLCFGYAVFVVHARKWKKLLLSLLSAAVGIAAAVLIFPASIDHIFSSYRGEEAFENAASSNLLDALGTYVSEIDEYFFGGLGIVVVAVLAVLLVVAAARGPRHSFEDPLKASIVIVCVSFAYVAVVAKVAFSQNPRFILAAMGLLYLGVLALLVNVSRRVSPRLDVVVPILACMILMSGYVHNDIWFAYSDEAENVSMIEERSDSKCLFIYDKSAKVKQSLLELRSLDDIVFASSDSWGVDEEHAYDCDSLIVYFTNETGLDFDEVLESLADDNGFETCAELFTYQYTTVYYLE